MREEHPSAIGAVSHVPFLPRTVRIGVSVVLSFPARSVETGPVFASPQTSRPWQAQSIWQAQSRRRSRPRVRARVRARAWAKVVREPRTCCGVGGGVGWSTRHSNMGCSGSKVEAEAARSKEEPGARRAQQQNIESLHSSSPSSRARSHGSVPFLRCLTLLALTLRALPLHNVR